MTMTFETQAHALHVIGLELRTSNDEAFTTIPAHWARFTAEAVLAKLPQRIGDEVYAVYTHFEHAGRDNQGSYSLVIGAAVRAQAVVPAGLVRVVVPASRRALFAVERGRVDRVGAAWQRIWQHDEIAKTFIAEYERYGSDGSITISVGVAAAPLAQAA